MSYCHLFWDGKSFYLGIYMHAYACIYAGICMHINLYACIYAYPISIDPYAIFYAY